MLTIRRLLVRVLGVLVPLYVSQAGAVAQEGTEPSTARARPQPDAERPPEHESRVRKEVKRRHQHEGGFVRFTLGGAYTTLTAALPAGAPFAEVLLRGAAVEFSGDLGGVIARNLILHLRYIAEILPAPSASADGGPERDARGASATMMATGPALTLYLMPANIYLTASAGMATLTLAQELAQETLVASTDFGLWLNADLGVEGWVSADWSFGIAARAMYAALPSSDGTHVDGVSLGLVLSASGALF